jgi:hypothetical protein
MEHRGRLAGNGRLFQQRSGTWGIARDTIARQQQQAQAQLSGGIALRCAALEPLERASVLAVLTVAARIQDAETQLASGVVLVRGRYKPALGFTEVSGHPESARVLLP